MSSNNRESTKTIKVDPATVTEGTVAWAPKSARSESDLSVELRAATINRNSTISKEKTFKQIFNFNDSFVKNNTIQPIIRFKVVDNTGANIAAYADATAATHGGLKLDFVCNILKELEIKYPGKVTQKYEFDDLRAVYKLKHLTSVVNARRTFPVNTGMSLSGVDADVDEMKATNAMIAGGEWVEIELPLPDGALFKTFPYVTDYGFDTQNISVEFTFRDPREWFVYGDAECAALAYTLNEASFEMNIHYAAIKATTVRDAVFGNTAGKKQQLPCLSQFIATRTLRSDTADETSVTVENTPHYVHSKGL